MPIQIAAARRIWYRHHLELGNLKERGILQDIETERHWYELLMFTFKQRCGQQERYAGAVSVSNQYSSGTGGCSLK
jgi:hypothetical protein